MLALVFCGIQIKSSHRLPWRTVLFLRSFSLVFFSTRHFIVLYKKALSSEHTPAELKLEHLKIFLFQFYNQLIWNSESILMCRESMTWFYTSKMVKSQLYQIMVMFQLSQFSNTVLMLLKKKKQKTIIFKYLCFSLIPCNHKPTNASLSHRVGKNKCLYTLPLTCGKKIRTAKTHS